jgi:hypothetical protein
MRGFGSTPSQNVTDPEHCGIVPVDGKDGRTLMTFDSVSVAGTDVAARTLAARFQNRFLQDHLVHHAIVYRPAYGKMKKMRNLNQKLLFYTGNGPKSFVFPCCTQQLILCFITDPNISCSHGVSISYSVSFSVQTVYRYLAARIR